MKKVILGLLMLVIGGCGYESPNTTNNMVVVTCGKSDYKGLCYYECDGSSTSSFVEIFSDDKWLFYDSCGKYTVGDTIVIGIKH